jgi:transcriptional regulator with XRE-family HTH domain
MDQEIGGRLRRIREQLGISQRQLARQSGVANATISQVEAGKINPTVSMLKKILDGIPISLGAFFADDQQPQKRLFFRSGELIEIARINPFSYLKNAISRAPEPGAMNLRTRARSAGSF